MVAVEGDLREAAKEDLDALLVLEERAFESDRLSRRAMRHWLQKEHRVFLVALVAERLVGYVLILHMPGTRLGRVYSLAVDPDMRGQGLGARLLEAGERAAAERGCIDVRLEVARDNDTAVRLYRRAGYVAFGVYEDYYEDHRDALRLQKRVRHVQADTTQLAVPWYQQSTDFTCGPAALMMALGYLQPGYDPGFGDELAIWREATTIFMTSGHGGCHPLGLALSATRRGLTAEVWIHGTRPLFVDGVRNETKKRVIAQVDSDLHAAVEAQGLPLHECAISVEEIVDACRDGRVVLLLVSTWRFERKKAPHWVVVSGFDAHCLYLHDPDPGEDQLTMDCQYTPVARGELERMQRFGRDRLQAAVVVGLPGGPTPEEEPPCEAR